MVVCSLISQKALTLEYSIVNKNKDLCGYEKIQFNKNDYHKIIQQRNVKDNYVESLEIIENVFSTKFKEKTLPIIIRENFIFKEEVIKEKGKGMTRICFMVHGLDGTADDLRQMRSVAQFYCPDTLFVLSEDNEENTWNNIETMGRRLANEVDGFLKYYTTGKNLEVSFLGHSLGGLIIRASLPYLKAYKPFFKTLITFATPHIGCLSNKFLVSTGMKVMSKFKKNKSLREMTLEDDGGYLIELSRREGFEWFDSVVLIASYNDGYVPYESSKILFSFQKSDKRHFLEMAKNIYKRFKGTRIVKLGLFAPDVNKGFNYYLGRQAHINVLDDAFLKHLIFYQIKDYL